MSPTWAAPKPGLAPALELVGGFESHPACARSVQPKMKGVLVEPIFLTCMAIAFIFSKGKVDSTAYENGKEPPSVAKARLRHESGGGARTPSGKPKGHGAFRLMMASRWANACAAAKQRSDHKAARRRAWYDETAPLKDEKWREKKLRRLNKANEARTKWANDHGLIDLSEYRKRKAEAEKEEERRRAAAELLTAAAADQNTTTAATDPATPTSKPVDGTEDKADKADKAETAPEQADPESKTDTTENTATDKPAPEAQISGETAPETGESAAAAPEKPETPETKPFDGARADVEDKAATEPAEPESKTETAEDTTPEDTTTDKPTRAATGTPAPNTTTEGSNTVYQQAVTDLIRAADQVAEYRADLSAFADTLDGKRWGAEVTGPIKDMDGQLLALEGDYRDLAAQMQSQGDQGANAYDQAPWVPGPEAVMA